ncbi:hypothetical protein D1872_294840 [compost metagenome]
MLRLIRKAGVQIRRKLIERQNVVVVIYFFQMFQGICLPVPDMFAGPCAEKIPVGAVNPQ